MNRSIVILVLLLVGCGGNSEDKRILADAAGIHNEMMEIAGHLETQIDDLQPDSLYLPADTVASIRQAFRAWESEVVEVPGNESHHSTHGEHHHEHQPVDVTAGQMLSIQTELKRRLLEIKTRVDRLEDRQRKNSF